MELRRRYGAEFDLALLVVGGNLIRSTSVQDETLYGAII